MHIFPTLNSQQNIMSFRTSAEYGHIIKFRCILNRSVHKNRMEENLNIWDFSLTEEETNEISTLDIGHIEIIDHSLASTAKWLNTWKNHN